MYNLGDFVNTTKGFMSVQCAITIRNNNNPRYDKLGGRTLYWLQDEQHQDIFLFDNELAKILIKDEQEIDAHEENSFSY